MNCLIVAKPENSTTRVLENFLRKKKVSCETVNDMLTGIQKARVFFYDLIIVDTKSNEKFINREIQLLKESNPLARIIVHTDCNTRSLETAVRKEQVFYYHVDTLGINVLKKAIITALQ